MPDIDHLATWRARLDLGAQHRRDADTVDALDWSTNDHGLPPGLEIQWLGTAGFRLSYNGVTILIDPYVSRGTLGDVVRRRTLLPSPDLVDRILPRADAVLVGHTHFDHAVDVPRIAARDSCRVFGSASLEQLMSLHGVSDQTTVVKPHQVYEIGPFEVTFVPSRHSKLIFGLKVPADGQLTCDCLDGLDAGAYRCGQVWGIHIAVAGHSFYHQGSADVVEDEVHHRNVDWFLMGIAGRAFTRDYVPRILALLEPKVVVPQHFDDFFRPIDVPMGFSFNVNLTEFVDEVERVSRDFAVWTPRPLEVIRGPG